MKHKKIIALALCLLMLAAPIATTSCSKDESVNTPVTAKVTNVYSPSFITIPDNYNFYGRNISVQNDRIYAICEEILNEETYETQTVVLSMNKDGSDLTAEPITPPASDNPDMQWYINNVSILSDLSKVYIANRYNPETSMQEYALIKIDASGNEVFNVNPQEMFPKNPEQDWFYVNQMFVGGGDMIYMTSDQTIVAVNPDGSKAFEITLENWIESVVSTPDGRTMIRYYDNETGGIVFQYIDTAAKGLGDKLELPSTINANNYEIVTGPGYDFYLKNNVGVYGYNNGDTEPKELLNWVNSDINPNEVREFFVLSESQFLYSARDMVTGKTQLAVLNHVPDEEVKEKVILTLGYVYADYSLPGYIVNFNRTNDKYRIQVKDYSIYNTQDNYELGMTTLNNDITAGNVPDILITSSDMPLTSYENKGLFADLYEFMDKDTELTRDKLLKCVRTPFENNGKLYRIGTSFSIQTLTGKVKNIGDKAGWTTAEMMNLMKSLPEGTLLFENMTRQSILYMMVGQGGGEFIDYENGTCNFNSEGFISLLEYAKTLPEEIDWNNYEYDPNQDYNAPYRNDKIILYQTYMSSFDTYLMEKVRFGIDEEINMIGYPTADGSNGTMINMYNSYAISAKSGSKEGAWEFIKYLLSDDVQINSQYRWDFPVTVTAFDKFVEAQMSQYYYFYNDGGWSSSSTPFDIYGNPIDSIGGSDSASAGVAVAPKAVEETVSEESSTEEAVTEETSGENATADAPAVEEVPQGEIRGVPAQLTQEDVDKIKSILDSITVAQGSYDEQVMNIIKEEADGFFKGSKSASDVANIIQGRISIYLSENS